jgi:hypothetical protein
MLITKGVLVISMVAPLAADGASDPVSWLLALGPGGIFAALIITGQLRTKAEVDNLKEEIAKRDRTIDQLATGVTGAAMPALAHATRLVEQTKPKGDEALIERMERLMTALEESADDGDSRRGPKK